MASRQRRPSSYPARLQGFLDVDHQQRLVQAQLEVVALAGELGDVLCLGAVGVDLGVALDGRQDGQVSILALATPSVQGGGTRPLGASARRSRRAVCSGRQPAECDACRHWRMCADALVRPPRSLRSGRRLGAPGSDRLFNAGIGILSC